MSDTPETDAALYDGPVNDDYSFHEHARKMERERNEARKELAALLANGVQDFEARIIPHILRNWDRQRIVGFATHLLGDKCQSCMHKTANGTLEPCWSCSSEDRPKWVPDGTSTVYPERGE